MTSAERAKYFGTFWPKVCVVKGWMPNDETRRRAVTSDCMAAVRGPLVSTSDPAFGHDEVTALFCYLDHLANPADLVRSARWVDCQNDYHAFNRAKQADWYEVKAYGAKGSKKLRRDRFAGQAKAQGGTFEPFNPRAINARFVTMASRAQKKARKANPAPVAEPQIQPPDPAYVAPAGLPF